MLGLCSQVVRAQAAFRDLSPTVLHQTLVSFSFLISVDESRICLFPSSLGLVTFPTDSHVPFPILISSFS